MIVSDKIILGLDPGTTTMGYGIIRIRKNNMEMISTGVIHLHKLENHELKLKKIFEKVSFLVDEYLPDEVAIEAPFFGKNVQSMLKLGRAQGVAMAAVLTRDLPIQEYAPRKIKQAITGNGNASKEQVAKMLQSLLKLKELPKKLDATDGLAAAVCHHFQAGKPDSGKKNYSGWGSFVKDNPDRTK
jgi:crossover junction endodeoxyribonuclease RuvC